MIANKPVRFCISLIHLSIALFCFAFCIGFTLTDKEGSLRRLISSNDFFPILICFSTGLFAFVGFSVWQRDNFSLSKQITYFTAFLGLVEYITMLIKATRAEMFLVVSLFFVAPILFVFLLGFSKVSTLFSPQINQIETLDSYFLQEDNDIKQVYFWKINRIVGVTFLVFSLFVGSAMLYKAPKEVFLPAFVISLLGSVLLLVFPKVGSYIFSTLSILTGAIFLPLVVFFIFEKKDSSSIDDIIFATSTVFCVSVFFVTIVMLLLSKEAKEEWKENNPSKNQ